MNDQVSQGEDSALLQEVLNEFLERLSKESTVPAHVLTALKDHFKDKPSISANEVKAILTAAAVVP